MCSQWEPAIGERNSGTGVAFAYCNALIRKDLGSDSASRFRVNSRNGTSRKRVMGNFGEVEIAAPRDRLGEFELQILPKHERRFTGFDKILSMYVRGMTTNRKPPAGEIPPSATPQAIPDHHKSKKTRMPSPPWLSHCQ